MTLKTYPASAGALAFPPLKGEAMDRLKESLLKYGQQFPITLYKGEVVDGRNRQEAFGQLYREKKLKPGFQFWTEELRDLTPTEFAKVANLDRRDLTPDQRAGVASKLIPLFAKEAKARQAEAAKKTNAARKRGEKAALSAPGRKAKPKTAAAEAAAMVGGVSARSVERFERVRKAEPALAKKVLDGEIDLTRAEKKIKHAEKLGQVRVLVLPDGVFEIVSVDFSWMYRQNLVASSTMRSGADYPRMTVGEICAFIREQLAPRCAATCVVPCWVTTPILLDLQTWAVVQAEFEKLGFRAATMRTWEKTTDDGELVTGLGSGIRIDTEHLVYFYRGDVVFNETGEAHGNPIQRTHFSAPVGAGSEKPQKAYDDLEALFPYTRRLELFARKPRANWVTGGSELAPGASTGEGEGGRSGASNISPASTGAVETFSQGAGSATAPELTVERVPEEAPPEIQPDETPRNEKDFDF